MRGRSRWFAASLAVVCLTAGLLRPRNRAEGQTVPPDITLSDAEFPASNWTVHVASSGGASQTAQQNATGGNPGAWRLMIHTLFPNSWVYVWHLYGGPGSTYNPSQQGAIDTLDFSLDQISISGNSVGGAFAVSQNGRYYTARYATFNNTSWQRVQGNCLTAANFVASDGGPDGSPDFSAAGGPIQFGFARANPVPSPSVSGIFDHGIDNWSVTIHRQAGPCGPPPTPTPSTCSGVFFATAVLAQANLGFPYQGLFNAVGAMPPYTFAVVSGVPPPGIFVSSAGTVSGTPTAVGSYTFSVQPTDATGCSGAVNPFTIVVSACPVLSFSPASLPDAVAGAPYRHVIAANPQPDAYTYVSPSLLPAGLTLAPDGVLSGIPTQTGTSSILVRVSGNPLIQGSSTFCTGDHTYSLTVGSCAAPPPPADLAIDRATASPGDLYTLTWSPIAGFGGHYDVLQSVDSGPFQGIGTTVAPAFTGIVTAAPSSTLRFAVKSDWFCGVNGVSLQGPSVALPVGPLRSTGALVALRALPGLRTVRVGVGSNRGTVFQANGPELLNRLPDPLFMQVTPDLFGLDPADKEDIFYSNADGTFNRDGSFITIEAWYPKEAPELGGLNISDVVLSFDNRDEQASAVAGFLALGDNSDSSTVSNVLDTSTSSFTVLGNTANAGGNARLRLTLAFPSSGPLPDLQVSIGGSFNGTGNYTRSATIKNVGNAAATGVTLAVGSGEFHNVSGGNLTCASADCVIEVGGLASGATAQVNFESTSGGGRTVTAADDGNHGPDANPSDNTASIPDIELCHTESCVCGVCHEVCDSIPQSIAHAVAEAARSVVRGLRSLAAAPARLALYYNFRDRILAATPTGRRYVQLYETHGSEVVGLLATDPTLRTLADSAMAAWEPALRVLLDGPGANATFTQPMAETMTALLERMKQIGGASLKADIAREQSLLDLSSLVGRTLDEAHRSIDAQPCAASDTALCLQGGRFRVEVAWKKSDGTTGPGHAAPLTADSGTFWFFDPSNVEMVVKALNGCGVDQRYWVFAGGLTNVEVTMTVTDTQTGEVKTYLNPQGAAFAPILDTQAFATCSAAALLAPDPEAPGARTPRSSHEAAQVQGAACAPGSTALCLDGARFRVEAVWTTAEGQTGSAQAVSLSPDSGYFWFFDPANVEMLVKVLNGCSIDASHWVFAGGLTNVRVVLTVTDTQTGMIQTYLNPQGSAFVPIQDTSAFPRCP